MSNWQTVPLNQVARVEFGTRVTRKRDGGSTFPAYGGGGATFMLDEWNREDCFIVSRFAMSEECVRKVEGRFFLNDSGLTVTTQDPTILAQAFLDQVLLAKSQDIYALGRGTAQRNLDVPAFRLLAVPLPPLDEQKRIAAKLDRISADVDQMTQYAASQIEKTNDLMSAWWRRQHGSAPSLNEKSWVPLSRLCRIRTGKRDVNQGNPDGRYPFFTCAAYPNKSDTYSFDEEAILIAGNGAVGQTNYFNGKFEAYQRTYVLTDFAQLTGRYLNSYLVTNLRPHLLRLAMGNTMPYIKLGMLNEFPVFVPSLQRQQEIVELIDEIVVQRARLHGLKQALMSELSDYRQSVSSELLCLAGRV